ncbi:acyl-CoA carboxylase subunit beta [Gordonia jinhuaensis]|uniref:Methylmalonyl-CoA carboxyltransferase n=1 Tax=Gordonia jinhuaensis TaxID=1517702 RepID=A0A916WVK0_9ACTN|nr:acyl-CoA carboxylase subunit beta [Gordonia jinhuaensis]GGB33394.1 methylmalonyl-CoA carboxyltransferase [Gordonia jinhuaensis]
MTDTLANTLDNNSKRSHRRTRMTVHERLQCIFDEDSFTEIGAERMHESAAFGLASKRHAGDGVVTGWGTVNGRPIALSATDFSVLGGSLGRAHAAKIHRIMDFALDQKIPYVCINDGGGARIQEGVGSLDGYGGIFRRHVKLSGVVPQISVIAGPCAGGAAYGPALSDFVFVIDELSETYLTGPAVVKKVTGEDVTGRSLGGAEVHSQRSGLAAFRCTDEEQCYEDVRYLLDILPSSCATPAPTWSRTANAEQSQERNNLILDSIVPESPRAAYDMREIFTLIVDDGDFLEVHEEWAPNLLIGFAHIDGRLVGIVGNQPSVLAGALDANAAEKGARFVRFCDCFSIPLLTFVDVPGFLPGSAEEQGGVIRRGAKLLYAYCEVTVPRVQVIVRKAFGGAYIVMDSIGLGANLSLAWPTNEIAVMGAEAAVEILHKRRLKQSSDVIGDVQQLADEYRNEVMHHTYSAERGFVDQLIDPSQTRGYIKRFLSAVSAGPHYGEDRKHGNHPQ